MNAQTLRLSRDVHTHVLPFPQTLCASLAGLLLRLLQELYQMVICTKAPPTEHWKSRSPFMQWQAEPQNRASPGSSSVRAQKDAMVLRWLERRASVTARPACFPVPVRRERRGPASKNWRKDRVPNAKIREKENKE